MRTRTNFFVLEKRRKRSSTRGERAAGRREWVRQTSSAFFRCHCDGLTDFAWGSVSSSLLLSRLSLSLSDSALCCCAVVDIQLDVLFNGLFSTNSHLCSYGTASLCRVVHTKGCVIDKVCTGDNGVLGCLCIWKIGMDEVSAFFALICVMLSGRYCAHCRRQ